jgi:hypothetical protein
MAKGGQLTRLCRDHIQDGKTCPHRDCEYAHVGKANFHDRIPDVAHQKLFCDFVTNSDKFTWAMGELTPQTQGS